ncbi:MAG: right-handed parallel beta-helix repeat-containing protein [Anaerolineae bacterium]|nr:right-handed parallel beta-helix repeat-containing protein [Anaerolineae bacterium]
MKKLMFVLMILALLIVPSTAMAGKSGNVWYVPGDFATIQDAIDSPNVADGDTIFVGPGSHAGALVTKAVEIKGEEGTVIDSGPMHPAGLSQGFRLLAESDGAVISHLRFEVDLAIMNGAAVNDVTVAHCTFADTIQGISNWSGSGWTISHNTITDLRTRNGGGIGILIADWTGGTVSDNVVAHNNVSGTLHVHPNDGGGYNGSGIVLYADFRWGWAGAEEISHNWVVKNKVSLVSDNPGVVDVAAFELTESYYPNPHPGLAFIVITDNSIGFNDFRGTTLQIALTPEELEDYNDISRNLGYDHDRGHGLHPSAFGPGG